MIPDHTREDERDRTTCKGCLWAEPRAADERDEDNTFWCGLYHKLIARWAADAQMPDVRPLTNTCKRMPTRFSV